MTTAPCRECGRPFIPTRRPALHCSTRCRNKFNRRRRDRGAELYDFIMEGNSTLVVAKLLGAYRTADNALREGRPSYQPITQAMLRLPVEFSGMTGDGRA